ncbi:MAG: hypothetical protein OHK0022_31480 [Roseiflexaceae bacterium]
MEGPSGKYSSLVIHVGPVSDGFWRVTVDTAGGVIDVPLQPVTLVVRVWQSQDGQLLRGTLHLEATQTIAPFQTNVHAKRIIRDWLINSSNDQP